MASTQVVWFRRELRVHDHPALIEASSAGSTVCVFVVDPALTQGPARSNFRADFLAESLADLNESLKALGNGLLVLQGDPAEQLPKLAADLGAAAVHWISDASPFAIRRDNRVANALQEVGVEASRHPGNYVANPAKVLTKAGGPFGVFTPFFKAWEQADWRSVLPTPTNLPAPAKAIRMLEESELPSSLQLGGDGSKPKVKLFEPGELGGRNAAADWLSQGIDRYHELHNSLAGENSSETLPFGGTSGLSPHLRWGTVSSRWLAEQAAEVGSDGARAYVRQLAWRDFYAHVYLFHPMSRGRSHQERFRNLEWDDDPEALSAWKTGQTGYPLVDAAMRQLAATGWMHNRARMVVGSFLTKTLHIDWREGEKHFWSLLIDGEPTQNDGNWQWIASTGVDPKPYFQRMFNPVLQQQRFDEDGRYVRHWVPELETVPQALLAEPWRMTAAQQQAANCVIGRDYPAPIVDHRAERERASARYKAASDSLPDSR